MALQPIAKDRPDILKEVIDGRNDLKIFDISDHEKSVTVYLKSEMHTGVVREEPDAAYALTFDKERKAFTQAKALFTPDVKVIPGETEHYYLLDNLYTEAGELHLTPGMGADFMVQSFPGKGDVLVARQKVASGEHMDVMVSPENITKQKVEGITLPLPVRWNRVGATAFDYARFLRPSMAMDKGFIYTGETSVQEPVAFFTAPANGPFAAVWRELNFPQKTGIVIANDAVLHVGETRDGRRFPTTLYRPEPRPGYTASTEPDWYGREFTGFNLRLVDAPEVFEKDGEMFAVLQDNKAIYFSETDNKMRLLRPTLPLPKGAKYKTAYSGWIASQLGDVKTPGPIVMTSLGDVYPAIGDALTVTPLMAPPKLVRAPKAILTAIDFL